MAEKMTPAQAKRQDYVLPFDAPVGGQLRRKGETVPLRKDQIDRFEAERARRQPTEKQEG